jgi:hypothetical protein
MGRKYLPHVQQPSIAVILNADLGQLELDLSTAFSLFDTYVDILTQRHAPELGTVLAGCDVLASDALERDHPALRIVEPPLVFCDRGFGASIIREGIPLPRELGLNPLPLIQIPYSRLREKYNLTSILHEVGHEVMIRLNLSSALPRVLHRTLRQAGASEELRALLGLWSGEIGPDLVTYCLSGRAGCGTREIFALPPGQCLRIAWNDPHPPPYLRVLLAFEWCRQTWGRGLWDQWEKEWIELYPLSHAGPATRNIIIQAKRHLPLVAEVLLGAKFSVLNGRTVPDLFDLRSVSPAKLDRIAASLTSGLSVLNGLRPAQQLAAFRAVRDLRLLGERDLDALMSNWLKMLAKTSQAKYEALSA